MVTLTPRKERSTAGVLRRVVRGQAERAVLRQTLIFSLASAINGGLVGVAGPSLHSLGEATGLGQAALGRVVFANRFAKLIGSFLWTAYAKAVQQGHAPCSARFVLACCNVVVAAAALAIATLRDSPGALRVGLGRLFN